jgi:hypothetical protein
MATDSKTPDPEPQKTNRFQVGLFLFLVLMAVAVYLLGVSMVNHRFFRGGRVDRYGHVRQ